MEFPGPEGMLIAAGDERIAADDPAAGTGATEADGVAAEDGAEDAVAGPALRAVYVDTVDDVGEVATVYGAASGDEGRDVRGGLKGRDSPDGLAVS